ncbi:hypothetical protein ACJ8LH_01575 [Serratia sp. CY49633]|uniref:hypothetical protein n=1 Tax=Serratia sp. CY49633 TaxID=3383629 RepID=UPI003FA174A1
MARLANRKAVSSPPAIVSIDEQLDEVVMTKLPGRELHFLNRILQFKKERIPESDISDEEFPMVDNLVRDGYLSVDFYDEDNNGGYHSLMQYYSLTDLGISAQKEEWKLRRHPNANKGR